VYIYYGKLKETDITPAKALLLLVLCAAWVTVGLVGHDPWKPNEAYGFGIIHHFLQSGDWLVPVLAGQPYPDRPPLYFWTAALFAKVLSPWLPLHDGARLATGFYMALTLLFTGFCGRELFGKYRGWPASIALIGCLGLLLNAHQTLLDHAFHAACAMLMNGYPLSLRRPRLAGGFIGLGLGIGFLGKGFIAPVLFLAISLFLLLFRNWRTRNHAEAFAIALLCALPWLAIWPWLLYQHAPALFTEWAWTRNIGRWLDFARSGNYPEIFYYLGALPWMAWPAAPLAVWTVWEARKRVWHKAEFQLLLTALAVMLVVLSLVPDINDPNGLPMLLPIALLATAALSTLRRGAANALDWFGIMTFALFAILLWWGWAGLLLDNNAWITRQFKQQHPDFIPAFDEIAFWIAIASTLLWIVLVWRTGRSVRRSLINWASGTTLLWILVMTLWRPWLDSGKSYRPMIDDLSAHLPADYQCMTLSHFGVSEQAMLEYFGKFKWSSREVARCDLLLVQGNRIARPIEDEIGWEKIWEGGRLGEQNERFRLYRRVKS